MNAQLLNRMENLSRTIAVWTSALATIIFAGVFFATDSNFGYQLQQFFVGKAVSIKLPVFLGMICAVFVGYLLAIKKQLAVVGGSIAMAAAAVIYTWCELWHLDPLSSFLLALAGPALFHLVSAQLRHVAAKKEVSMRSQESQPVACHNSIPEDANEERQVAFGAA